MELLVSLLVGALGGGTVGTMVSQVMARRKVAAETVDVFTEAMEKIVNQYVRSNEAYVTNNQMLNEQLASLSSRISFLSDTVRRMRRRVHQLETHMNDNGIPIPPEEPITDEHPATAP